jgi:hypothetical protein
MKNQVPGQVTTTTLSVAGTAAQAAAKAGRAPAARIDRPENCGAFTDNIVASEPQLAGNNILFFGFARSSS